MPDTSPATMRNGDTIRERVARGATLLDSRRPGWAARIILDELAMETCDRCILGQVYGGYWPGCWALVATLPNDFLFSSVDHGFTIPNEDQRFTGDEMQAEIVGRFNALADAWRSEVRRRVERIDETE